MANYYDKSGTLITPESPRRPGSGIWIESEGRFAWPYTLDGTKLHYGDFTTEEKEWYKRNDERFACRQPGHKAGTSTVRKVVVTESSLMIRTFIASAEFVPVEHRVTMFTQQMMLHQGTIIVLSSDVEKLVKLLFEKETSTTYQNMIRWSKQSCFNFANVAELNEFLTMARGE